MNRNTLGWLTMAGFFITLLVVLVLLYGCTTKPDYSAETEFDEEDHKALINDKVIKKK